jgi:hypothetical protein
LELTGLTLTAKFLGLLQHSVSLQELTLGKVNLQDEPPKKVKARIGCPNFDEQMKNLEQIEGWLPALKIFRFQLWQETLALVQTIEEFDWRVFEMMTPKR